MILSFANKRLELFFHQDQLNGRMGWQGARKIVRRKLMMLDAATVVSDLKAPPGNRLELLHGDLEGFFSIRVNDQWRVIFKWESGSRGPTEVNVVDYH